MKTNGAVFDAFQEIEKSRLDLPLPEKPESRDGLEAIFTEWPRFYGGNSDKKTSLSHE
jgi:hypothetical protein